MTTAPWDASVAQLVTQTHEQTFRLEATVAGVTTDLELVKDQWHLDYSETRTPRAYGEFTVKAPDAALITALDPRTLVRVTAYPGYRLASGVHEEHAVKLFLRTRTVNRPDNTMTLVATSADGVLVDACQDVDVPLLGTTTWTSAAAAIQATITTRLSTGPLAGPTINNTAPTNTGEFEASTQVSDFWNIIESATDSIGGQVYADDDAAFWITLRPFDASADPSHTLSVGSNGTIIESQTTCDRDDWANFVSVQFTWQNAAGAELSTYGQAFVQGGPFAPASAGIKAYTEERRGSYMRNVTAKQIARTLIQRLLARSRTYRLRAVTAWWLRPGMVVTVNLPTGESARHIVASVAFDPGGMMTVETRLPDTASTLGE